MLKTKILALLVLFVVFSSAQGFAASGARDAIEMMDRATPQELGALFDLVPGRDGEMVLEPEESSFLSAVNIYVSVGSQTLTVASPEGQYSMPVSTARPGYHTARGCFRRPHLERMHYSKKWDNAPMPHSMFYYGGFAIHGTYEERHLGRPASHGCIRVSRANASYLYALVKRYGASQTRICVR